MRTLQHTQRSSNSEKKITNLRAAGQPARACALSAQNAKARARPPPRLGTGLRSLTDSAGTHAEPNQPSSRRSCGRLHALQPRLQRPLTRQPSPTHRPGHGHRGTALRRGAEPLSRAATLCRAADPHRQARHCRAVPPRRATPPPRRRRHAAATVAMLLPSCRRCCDAVTVPAAQSLHRCAPFRDAEQPRSCHAAQLCPRAVPHCSLRRVDALRTHIESSRIEPRPTARTPATSAMVLITRSIDCASARRTSEARVEGEWGVKGLVLPKGDLCESFPATPGPRAGRTRAWRAA
jgi:hypothetical protein